MCRQVLLWEPDLVTWAVVGTANYPALPSVIELCPRPPHTRAHIEALGLRGTLVDAVQGIQLVTGTHLARAHDLSGWQVTQVTPDRYLVEARELAPWFTGTRIDEAPGLPSSRTPKWSAKRHFEAVWRPLRGISR